jgi:predicted pyridoxine 5'-phosphate oxidase superfamily flavin-nucleotide-binding protein
VFSNGVFHEGELFVQERAGLTDEALRFTRMLGAREFSYAMSSFVADRDLAFVTSRDSSGMLWTSAVYGEPGFCQADRATLHVKGRPLRGDPLHELQRGAQIGLLFIDFHRRRRLRVNGVLGVRDDGFDVIVDQVYGNCPQYIRQREAEPVVVPGATHPTVSFHPRAEPTHLEQVSRADTFILGTSHPSRGADTSHRGGPTGFVRVEGDELWWPDYPGNNLFNSMGNIAVDPATALLFLDFRAGTSLQMSGTAQLDWNVPHLRDDESATGRRVRFTPVRTVHTRGIPLAAA